MLPARFKEEANNTPGEYQKFAAFTRRGILPL
jgi:hypothetical protein